MFLLGAIAEGMGMGMLSAIAEGMGMGMLNERAQQIVDETGKEAVRKIDEQVRQFE